MWPYVYEFADNAVEAVKQRLSLLSEAGEACELYAIHGHHANGGEVAALMAHTIGADMVMTGHKLGRKKLDHLLTTGNPKQFPRLPASAVSILFFFLCNFVAVACSEGGLTSCDQARCADILDLGMQ